MAFARPPMVLHSVLQEEEEEEEEEEESGEETTGCYTDTAIGAII